MFRAPAPNSARDRFVLRAEFRASEGFDPIELFDAGSRHFRVKDAAGLNRFLDFRAELAQRQQAEWIDQVEQVRRTKPGLDLVLTHVDDRFDGSMREKIGADASKVLPLLNDHDFTFLIEDPATVWNLGPQRYGQIAERYKPLTPRQNKLAIDINVVERYQDVYPVKRQTGTELFELVHQAAMTFPRVALYFESSLAPADLPLLAASAALVQRVETSGDKLVVQTRSTTGVRWTGAALVDGRLWPAANDDLLWLPPGSHSIQPAAKSPPLRLLDFNGELLSASASGDSIVFGYRSSAQALAVLERAPKRVEIDGEEVNNGINGNVLKLPRGQHLVTVW